MDLNTEKRLAKLLAEKFIARPDVKALQRPNGEWFPVESPIVMADLLGHLRGTQSMGHYMLSQDSQVKLFALDIDLEKSSPEKEIFWPMPTAYNDAVGDWFDFRPDDPRDIWERLRNDWPTNLNILHRDFLIFQLRTCAVHLVTSIIELLQIPVAVSYSGHKGLHVYGFTGLVSASEAREAASIVLDHAGFKLHRGRNFYKFAHKEPNIMALPQLSVEVFPKQSSLDAKGFGNLMRLPLGKNRVANPAHPHQAKFIDVRARYVELVERNPIEALTLDDPWAGEL